MNRNNRRKAFTLVELMTVILIVVFVAFFVMQKLAAPRRHRYNIIMQHNGHIRNTHTACILYSQGNRDLYPGLSIDAKRLDGLIDAADIDKAIDDSSASHTRLQILANKEFLPPEHLLSPKEKSRQSWPGQGHTITRDHTSYALLNITDPEGDKLRRKEWTNTMNNLAVVIADRAFSPDAPFDPQNVDNDKNIQSIWTKKPGDWKGSVGWNDNHVTFEVSHIIGITQYGETTNQNDSLFRYDDTPDTSANAFLIWGKGVDTSE